MNFNFDIYGRKRKIQVKKTTNDIKLNTHITNAGKMRGWRSNGNLNERLMKENGEIFLTSIFLPFKVYISEQHSTITRFRQES